jgi:hypothetical protein
MAADALLRLGAGASVHSWLDVYVRRLDDAPPPADPVDPDRWQLALGEVRLLPSWLALMTRELAQAPWRDVLDVWWPRLLPGVVAGATHGVIRTGHAVRALLEVDNTVRRTELAHALAYWAARWQPVPGTDDTNGRHGRGTLGPPAALATLPMLHSDADGIRARLRSLAQQPQWPGALHALDEEDAEPRRLLHQIAAAAVDRYPANAVGNAVMLIHSVTAPAAIDLALPALDQRHWRASVHAAWSAAAAITAVYTPVRPTSDPDLAAALIDSDELTAAAAAHADEHVVKLAEAAVRVTDPQTAARAVAQAITLIDPAPIRRRMG